MIAAPEADVDVAPTVIPKEEVEKQQAAVEAKRADAPVEPDPDAPPDKSPAFNQMKQKLEAALKQQPTKPEPKAEAKAEPKAEKKETPKTQEEPPKEELPKAITGPRAQQWKELHEKTEKWQKKAVELEAKIAALEKQDATKAQIADLDTAKKRLAEVEAEKDSVLKKLEVVALERSDRFQRHYENRFNDAVALAKQHVSEADAARIADLMSLPPSPHRQKELEEIMADMTPYKNSMLAQAITQYDKARMDRDRELSDSRENYKRLQQSEAEMKQVEQRQKLALIEQETAKVLQVAEEFDAFKLKAGDEVHNARARENRRKLQSFLKAELPDAEIKTMPILAAEGERLANVVVPAMAKEIEELKGALAKYQQAEPNINGDGEARESAGQAESSFPGGGGFLKAFKQAMKG